MPQSPMVSLADIVRRYFTESYNIFTGYATITDGINSSVYFKREFFFGAQFLFVKPSVIFLLLTNFMMECGITNERYADGHFSSVI
jgi:hypothetical protein